MTIRAADLHLLAAAGLAALLGGCTAGPKYSAPRTPLPASFAAATTAPGDATPSQPENGGAVLARWWLGFHDDELASLVQRALQGNHDLKIAAARVRQARLQRAIAAGGLGPEVDVTAGYNRGHGSDNVTLPFGNPASAPGGATKLSRQSEQVPGAAPPATPPAAPERPAGPQSPLGEGGLPGVTTNLYQVGFDATWELDLFGGRRRAIESADAQAGAAEEAERDVLVSLLAEVAQTYLSLRADQQRLGLARENIRVAEDTLEVIRAKAKNGFATDLEVARQQAELATLQATVPDLETEERLSIHALAFLVGAAPDALAAELDTTARPAALPPVVPVGLPSELLRRRPDIRRAERELAGATAQVGVATADLFPTFNLAAAFGLDSSTPGDLLRWSSHYYSITPGLRWTLFDRARARDGVRLADEMRGEALERYEAAVAQAVLDVENALVRFRNGQRARAGRVAARDASRVAFTIARQRYEHGLVDSLVVLDAQRSLIAAEDALARSDASVRTDLVALYKALGGGWET